MATKIETIFMATQNENIWETCLCDNATKALGWPVMFIQGLLHTQAKLLYKCILNH
jgi:hypothetical protein